MAADATQIVLLQLRQHGIDVDQSLTFATFSADTLYAVCRRLFTLVPSSFDDDIVAKLPEKLPAAASSRFNLCAKVVTQLNNAGLGVEFNALMYPTEDSARSILTWVVARLAAAADDEARGAGDADGDVAAQAGGQISALQRGLRALRAKVSAAEGAGAIVSKKVKESATEGVYLPPSRAGTAGRPSMLLLPFRGAALAAEQLAVDAAASEHEALWKQPNVPSAPQPRAPFGLFVRDTISNALAILRARDPAFDDQCRAAFASPNLATAAENAARRKGGRKGKSKQALDAGDDGSDGAKGAASPAAGFSAFATEALFANSDNAMTARELRRAEEAAEAAQKGLETVAATVEQQLAAREAEAETIKDQLREAKRVVAAQHARLAELQREQQEAQEAAEAEAAEAQRQIELLDAEAAKLAEREAQLSLMEDADASIAQLQEEVESLQQKRAEVKQEAAQKLAKIEAKRDALIAEATTAGAGREDELAKLRHEAKALKKTLKERAAEITKLEAQLEACPKDIDRGSFLRLIFDLTSNIRKQQEQIDKAKREIHTQDEEIAKLQAAIKALFEDLESRAFDSATGKSGAYDDKKKADDKKKKDSAGKDDAVDAFGRDVFRRFVELRRAYADLVEAIESRGEVRREAHETEQLAGKLHLTVAGYNVAGVEADLQLVAAENEQLQAAIDAAASSE